MARLRIAALGLLLCLLPAAPVGAGDGELRRWLGAEGGFDEMACSAPGSECPGFSQVTSFDGEVRSVRTMTEAQDPDGVHRPWPARTGNRLFLASVPGGVPATAHLSTAGASPPSTAPITVSFGIRFHAPPVNPILVYRHADQNPARVVALAVTPSGQIQPFVGARAGRPSPPLLTVGRWHGMTVTYGGPDPLAPLKVYLDDEAILTGALPLGGPSGPLDVGIVGPTPVPTTLGIDDYVEAAGYDAPIRGARINYLMPLGRVGEERWSRAHPVAACRNAARNWQMVSEDQPLTAGGQACALEDGALTASTGGLVDQFLLEGVPSKHQATASYSRIVHDQPSSGETVLGVRLRMRGRTDGPTLTWSLGYVDQGTVVGDDFTLGGGGTGGPVTLWGSTRETRPGGQAWSRAALDGLRLRLDSGSGSGTRRVTETRLDYVWLP